MKILRTIAETRALLDAARAGGESVGFVPTMGYLHAGHASLMTVAREENDQLVVSIFVNPLQFGANEDLDAYPRDPERDAALCDAEGVDVIFWPDVSEMYPEPNPFVVSVGDIGTRLCGATRPGHFDGVATVVSKLWNIIGPSRSYFGRKDAQQLVVLQRLARAFDVPVEVIGCPIIRDPDGLALSSRNVYLSDDERAAALVLSRALTEAIEAAGKGERDGRRIASMLAARIASEPLARLDYASVVNPGTLEDLEDIDGDALLAVAAWIGKARLIDNMLIDNTTVTPDGASNGRTR